MRIQSFKLDISIFQASQIVNFKSESQSGSLDNPVDLCEFLANNEKEKLIGYIIPPDQSMTRLLVFTKENLIVGG